MPQTDEVRAVRIDFLSTEIRDVAVAWSGERLLVAAATEVGTRLYDVLSGRQLNLQGSGSGFSVAINGDVVATGAGDSLVHLNSATTGDHLRSLAGHSPGSWVSAVTFAGANQLLTAGTDGAVLAWHSENSPSRIYGPGLPVWDVQLGPGGKRSTETIILGCRDGVLRLIDGEDISELGMLAESITTVGLVDSAVPKIAWLGDSDVGLFDPSDGRAIKRRRGPWTAMATSAADTPQPIYAAQGDGTLFSLTVPDLLVGQIVALEEPVRSLALVGGDVPVLVAGGQGGSILIVPLGAGEVADRLNTVHESMRPINPSALTRQTQFQSDQETENDQLNPRHLAAAVVKRLYNHYERERSTLILLIDGKWGTGKSSLMKMIGRELVDQSRDWTVAQYNAWQQASAGPTWLTILNSIRGAVYAKMGPIQRLVTRSSELWHQRVSRTPVLLALIFGLCFCLGVWLWLRPRGFTAASFLDAAKTAVAAATSLGALWGLLFVTARFFSMGSRRGAKFVEETSENPAQQVADNVAWLLRRRRKPVALLIDDLDRCDRATLVKVLETVQTVLRPASDHSTSTPRGEPLYIVCAADRAWVSRAFQAEYADFESALDEPGRSLGYLFCDKIFQAIVPVPVLDEVRRGTFLAQLLSNGTPATLPDSRLVQKIQASHTEDEVLAALSEANPDDRSSVSGYAVDQITDSRIQQGVEHALMRFVPLLPPNPRAIVRFINDYTLLRAVRTTEGSVVPLEALAQWVILNTRWPELGMALADHPDMVEASPASSVPDELRQLLERGDVQQVLHFQDGTELNAALVRQCCGAMLAAE